jgi:hypothetical protein
MLKFSEEKHRISLKNRRMPTANIQGKKNYD